MNETQKKEIKSTLAQFHGTSEYHRFSVLTSLVLTDGAKYLAEKCDAYWLMDVIGSYQRKLTGEEFQVWTLRRLDQCRVNDAVVYCTDGNNNTLTRQLIPYTDFPLSKITLWCVNGVIMLPSEY